MDKFKYWVQSKFRKRIKIDTLNAQYHDAVEELLHVNFQVLVDFVEDEEVGISQINWDSTPEHKHVYAEMEMLYDWWIVDRPSRVDPVENPDLVHPPMDFKDLGNGYSQLLPYDVVKYSEYDSALKESMRLDKEWWEEDQRNLHRLIDIRPFLWT